MKMPHKLIGAGVMGTGSADGQLRILLPRPLKAKVVAVVQTRKMRWRSPRKAKSSEAQQLEITATKKFEIAKLSEKRNA